MGNAPPSSLLSGLRTNEYIRLASLGMAAFFVLKVAGSQSTWMRDPYAPGAVGGVEIDPHVYFVYAKVDHAGGGDFMVERVRFPSSPAVVKRIEDTWRGYLGQPATEGGAPTMGDFGVKKRAA